MKKKLLFFALFIISITGLPKGSYSQGVGIGTATPDPSAIFDIRHTGKGLLIPRMTTSSINSIANPAKGLLVYDSLTNQLMVNMGTPAVRNWQTIASNSNWNLGGNSGVNVVTQFVGTNDNRPLRFRVNGIQAGELSPATGNIFWGLRAGETTTTGYSNIAIGPDALKRNSVRSNLIAIGDSALYNNGVGASPMEAFANIAIGSKSLYTNTRGSSNTAIGNYSLYSNITGNRNTATGASSLFTNTTGFSNTATGFESLLFNSTGFNNTATGSQALFNNNGSANTVMGAAAMFSNITGNSNTAIGFQSLKANIEGNFNTATGCEALNSNTIGNNNTANGFQALSSSTTGNSNAAVGYESLSSNTTGSNNTSVGSSALYYNTTGAGNTAVGEQALYVNAAAGNYNTAVGVQTLHATVNSQNNTAVGYFAANLFNLGFNNTFLGANSDANQAGLFNSVAIGESARITGSGQVRLGNTATTSIGGVVGYTNLSDGRYKKNIQEEVKGIDFIMKLRPVTYQLDISGLNKKLNIDKEKDETSKRAIAEKEKTIFSGFVAQEVEQAAKDVGYDFSGIDKPKNENDIYGLRYAEFVVPLVKAMQEQQQMINELRKQNAELQKRVNDLEKK
jgi:hypothetical protein